MHIIGLRRIRIAPIVLDSEGLLLYGTVRKIADTALCVAGGAELAGEPFFRTDGSRARCGYCAADEITVTFAEPDEAALALILGEAAFNGADGAATGGAYSINGASPCFALGFEAFAVHDDDANGSMEAVLNREAAFEKTWLYKCSARRGAFARAAVAAAPKPASVEIIVTHYPTVRRYNGKRLTIARLGPQENARGVLFEEGRLAI